jgi:RNA polymerase sigma-70 factor (ECF subfamily)
MERSEEETLRRVADGDLVELEILCRRHTTKLCNFAYRFLWDWSDAEEAVQEIMFRVFKLALDGHFVEDPTVFLSTTYTIAVNLCSEKMSERRGGEGAAEAQPAEEVDEALARLTTNHRSALLLKDYGGLNYSEIGRALNRSTDQVKALVYQARRQVADGVGDGAELTVDEAQQCDVAGEEISVQLDGELSGIDAARVEAHLKKCRDCAREMDALKSCRKRVQGIVDRKPSPTLETVLKRRSQDYLDGFRAQQRRTRMALAARAWAIRAIVAAIVVAVAGWGVYLAGQLRSTRLAEVGTSEGIATPTGTTPAEGTTRPADAGVPGREGTAATAGDTRRPGRSPEPRGPREQGHTGWWRVSFGSPPTDMGFVKLTQDGETVAAPGDSYLKGQGRLDGSEMVITRAGAGARAEFTLQAEFDGDGQSFAGTADSSYDGGRYRSSVRIFGEKAAPEQAAILNSQAKAAGTIAEREKRLKEVYGALQRYAREHSGTFPDELPELVPAYLDDSGLVVGAQGVREVEYQRGMQMPPRPDETLPSDARLDVSPQEAPELYANGADERVEPFFTELISESWNIAPCGRAVLYLDGTTAWARDPAKVPPLPPDVAERRANQRMLACQENMSRLGSALGRWLRDWEGIYPLNLESLYPAWLTDLRVMGCPEEEPHTVCYELLYTGESRPIDEDFETPEAATEYYATMPVLVETGEPHFGGRNVLYMDGHTEWRDVSERY